MAQFMKTFRRHRKAWLAGLTVMAMFAFVFLGSVGSISDLWLNRAGRRNPVVIETTKYGSIRESQLVHMLRQRGVLHSFFQRLQAAVLSKGGRALQVRAAIMALGDSPANEESAVDHWLLMQKAEDLGLRVSEKAVNDYLTSLTEGKVGNEEVKRILTGLRLSQTHLFEMLRQELLARELYGMFRLSLAAATPSQRWEYYLELNRRAKIEAVPIAVSKFVAEVQDPPETTLREFFEKHKDKLPDPDSPEPGFKEPHRIDVEYLKARYESFVDPAAVTDQAIREFYEANKEQLYRDLLPEEPKAVPPKVGPAKSQASGQAPGKTEAAKPGATKPAEAAKPAPAAPEPAKGSPPESAPGKKTSAAPRRSVFRFVSEQKGEPAAKTPAPTPGAFRPTISPALPSAPAPPAGAPVKYKPLADVKEEIRKSLARQQAQEKIKEVFRRIEDKLSQFEAQWTYYDTLEEKKKAAATPPARPDFAALAKENRLSAAQTGLISALDARGLDIGDSTAESGAPFREMAFDKNYPLYRFGVSQDTEGNSYLFWKVGDAPERVPSLDDAGVRRRVVEAWKTIEARALATGEAEKLAAEAQAAKKPLHEVFAGRKDLHVITPEPFTWLTFGSTGYLYQPVAPRPSKVNGIDGAGRDFMHAVFALKAGEVGPAMNQPKSVVYVVRVGEYTPSETVLWDMFVTDDYGRYMLAARYDQEAADRLWREGLKSEAGVQWKREPTRGHVGVED